MNTEHGCLTWYDLSPKIHDSDFFCQNMPIDENQLCKVIYVIYT